MTTDEALAGLDELARRYGLTGRAREQLAALLSLIEQDVRAPTSVRDTSRALDVHVADSLVALEFDAVRAARTLADIGSGPGFPGLALAAALPRTRTRTPPSAPPRSSACAGSRSAASPRSRARPIATCISSRRSKRRRRGFPGVPEWPGSARSAADGPPPRPVCPLSGDGR